MRDQSQVSISIIYGANRKIDMSLLFSVNYGDIERYAICLAGFPQA
jgi:hypothetical protein